MSLRESLIELATGLEEQAAEIKGRDEAISAPAAASILKLAASTVKAIAQMADVAPAQPKVDVNSMLLGSPLGDRLAIEEAKAEFKNLQKVNQLQEQVGEKSIECMDGPLEMTNVTVPANGKPGDKIVLGGRHVYQLTKSGSRAKYLAKESAELATKLDLAAGAMSFSGEGLVGIVEPAPGPKIEVVGE